MRLIKENLAQELDVMKTIRQGLLRVPGVASLYQTLFPGIISRRENRPTLPTKTKHGYTLVATHQGSHLQMLSDDFEPEETSLLASYICQCDVFVDVGANIGYYTCLARSLGKRVVAVEPQPRNLAYLYENLKRNGWQDSEVFPVGLGSAPGLLEIYGDTGPSASMIKNWANLSPTHVQTVPVTTLDRVVTSIDSKLFIKIDVEGFEYEVLRGAAKTLALLPKPTWMIEICLNEFHPGGLNPHYQDTFELFWQHGYQARTANVRGAQITREAVEGWVKQKRCESGTINYIFEA